MKTMSTRRTENGDTIVQVKKKISISKISYQDSEVISRESFLQPLQRYTYGDIPLTSLKNI